MHLQLEKISWCVFGWSKLHLLTKNRGHVDIETNSEFWRKVVLKVLSNIFPKCLEYRYKGKSVAIRKSTFLEFFISRESRHKFGEITSAACYSKKFYVTVLKKKISWIKLKWKMRVLPLEL